MIKTELITSYLKEKGISKTEFAKQCKISDATLAKALKNVKGLRLVSLLKIARFLKIELLDFFPKENSGQ